MGGPIRAVSDRLMGALEEAICPGSPAGARELGEAAKFFLLMEDLGESSRDLATKTANHFAIAKDRSPRDAKEALKSIAAVLQRDVYTKSAAIGIGGIYAEMLGVHVTKKTVEEMARAARSHAVGEFCLDVGFKGGKVFIETSCPEWQGRLRDLTTEILEYLSGDTEKSLAEILSEHIKRFSQQIEDLGSLPSTCHEFWASTEDMTLAGEMSTEDFDALSLAAHAEDLLEQNLEVAWSGVIGQHLKSGILKKKLPRGSVIDDVADAADDHAYKIFAGSVDDIALSMTDDVVGATDDIVGLADDVFLASADDVATGVMGGALASVPILTILWSSIREVNLLSQDNTDWETSFANILLDTVGTGGGAAVGAVVGSFFAPGPGTVIGAALGGLFGRAGTNKLKRLDFEAAQDHYRSSYHLATQTQDSASHKFYKEICRRSKRSLKTSFEGIQEYPCPAVWRELLAPIAVRFESEVRRHIEGAQQEIEPIRKRLLTTLPKENLALRLLRVSVRDLVKEELIVRLSRLESGLNQTLSRMPSRKQVAEDPIRFFAWLGDIADLPHGRRIDNLLGIAKVLASATEIQMALLVVWARGVASIEYREAAGVMRAAKKGSDTYQRKVSKPIKNVKRAAERVDREMRKLGKKK